MTATGGYLVSLQVSLLSCCAALTRGEHRAHSCEPSSVRATASTSCSLFSITSLATDDEWLCSDRFNTVIPAIAVRQQQLAATAASQCALDAPDSGAAARTISRLARQRKQPPCGRVGLLAVRQTPARGHAARPGVGRQRTRGAQKGERDGRVGTQRTQARTRKETSRSEA